MSKHIQRMSLFVVVALLCVSTSLLVGCKKKQETPVVPAPVQATQQATAPQVPDIGDPYIKAISSEHQVAAARVAEKYIKEKTPNHLDSLQLNPKSPYWEFPSDLTEFNKYGLIIVFDAYVDNKTDKPYRIVLIRGSENSAKWDVKRFGPENNNVTNDGDNKGQASQGSSNSQSDSKNTKAQSGSQAKSSRQKSNNTSSNKSSSNKSSSTNKSSSNKQSNN